MKIPSDVPMIHIGMYIPASTLKRVAAIADRENAEMDIVMRRLISSSLVGEERAFRGEDEVQEE